MSANGFSPLKVPATLKVKKDSVTKNIQVYQRFDRSAKMRTQAIKDLFDQVYLQMSPNHTHPFQLFFEQSKPADWKAVKITEKILQNIFDSLKITVAKSLCKYVFDYFDRNKDGFITIDEFDAV